MVRIDTMATGREPATHERLGPHTYADWVALPEDGPRYGDGQYREAVVVSEDGTFAPTIFPGLTIRLADLWA